MTENEHHEKKSPIFYTWLVGLVENSSVKDVMKDIDKANSEEHIKEIILTIASPGGGIYPGIALYDHIKASKKPIDIITEGYCMSAAVMILQAARKRISRPHTVFMVHPSSYVVEKEIPRPYSEFLTMVEDYKNQHDLVVRLSITRSGIRRKEYEAMYNPRKYFTSEEALKFGPHGLIDEIREK
ncbi:MAG TPA: ATP-dependent Clp protease proteolytic subunit [Patescibacteria group bacterium]|nr:ATP-dependent Clp protease proteolytic subunit [Patescibacteria group bacterium]